MLRIVAALLIAWEPARFAIEALTVVPPITYRGAAAAVELAIHGCVAALAAAAGPAPGNAAPDGREHASSTSGPAPLRTSRPCASTAPPTATPPGGDRIKASLSGEGAEGGTVKVRNGKR